MRRSFVFFMDCGGFSRLDGKFGGMRNFWKKKRFDTGKISLTTKRKFLEQQLLLSIPQPSVI
jgi:hypothetical protein